MKKLKRNLIITAFLAFLTLFGSLFTVSNFPVQTAAAQTNVGGGPQDGGDGKKKRCRPPRVCSPSNPISSRQNEIETTESNVAGEVESSDWWDDFIDWLFGE